MAPEEEERGHCCSSAYEEPENLKRPRLGRPFEMGELPITPHYYEMTIKLPARSNE